MVKRCTLLIGFCISLLLLGSAPVAILAEDGEYDLSGPYLDKLIYNFIDGENQQVLALMNGDIDIINDFLDISYVGLLTGQEKESLQKYGMACQIPWTRLFQ